MDGVGLASILVCASPADALHRSPNPDSNTVAAFQSEGILESRIANSKDGSVMQLIPSPQISPPYQTTTPKASFRSDFRATLHHLVTVLKHRSTASFTMLSHV